MCFLIQLSDFLLSVYIKIIIVKNMNELCIFWFIDLHIICFYNLFCSIQFSGTSITICI